MTSFRTVRAMDAEMREYNHYKQQLADVHKLTVKTAVVSGVCGRHHPLGRRRRRGRSSLVRL